MRALQCWSTLLAALVARDEAIAKVCNFKVFNIANLSRLIATGAPGSVDYYTSKLCSYRNNADPSNYSAYHHRVEVVINSPGTLVAICRVHYSAMYQHMMYLMAQNNLADAKFYCALLGRIVLTTCKVMVVRDLLFVGNPKADQKRSRYLRQLTVPIGRIAPPRANLLAAVAELPVGGSGVTPFEADVRTVFSAEKRVHDSNLDVQYPPPPPVPVTRTLLYSGANTPNVDAFDQRNRGYQFSVKTRCEIEVSSMVTMLNNLGCNAENPFHLFLAVPQDIFEDCINAQALYTDVPPPTGEDSAFVNAAVLQYVIRLPKSIT